MSHFLGAMSDSHCVNLDPASADVDNVLMVKYLQTGVDEPAAAKPTDSLGTENGEPLSIMPKMKAPEPILFQASKALGKFYLQAQPVPQPFVGYRYI